MATNKKISYNDIRDKHEDWALDVRNGKRYSGMSVQNFIKKTFDEKFGYIHYDNESNRYFIFADEESKELYLDNPIEHSDLLLGNFDAPANYTAEINLTTPTVNTILVGATGNYIDFTFDIVNKSGASTGDSVVVKITFRNSGNTREITQILNAGTAAHILIDDYLANGSNNITVGITGRTTLAATTVNITYNVVDITLSSTYDLSVPVTDNILAVPYTLAGAGVKYLEWYIDNTLLGTDTIADISVSRTKNIDVTSLAEGKHNVQFRAYITDGTSNYYSDVLYYDFYKEISGGSVEILLGTRMSVPSGEISISASQFVAIEYKIAIHDNSGSISAVNMADNGVQKSTISLVPDEMLSASYTPSEAGTHILTFSVGNVSASMTLEVSESDIDIHEETDGLLLKLSAKDRSNNEADPAQWTYGSYETTFTGFAWNEQSGWNNGALVIAKNSYIDISCSPLRGNSITRGKTIELDFECTDIESDDASVLTLINSQTGAGLNITASTASLMASGGSQVNTKFNAGDRVHLSFVINRTVGENSLLMFIINNGVLERAASFAASDSFAVSDALRIGSAGCIMKLYSIRVYDKNLTVDQAFGNYAVDAQNIFEVASRNDIINPATGNIDIDKVNSHLPVWIITGDMQPIFNTTDKNTTVYVDCEYRDMQNPSRNFTARHVRMRPQGTSSLGYPRKNLRPYTASKYGCTMYNSAGEVIEDGLYSFKEGAAPVNCWTLKADYAESSGSHNTGVARMWNKLMFDAVIDGENLLRTNAQVAALENDYGYDVRTTIDGFPIVVFWKPTESSQPICLGQYNFNNDKSTEKVFGFVDIPGFDNTHVQCFEFLANENPICLFDDVSNFDTGWSDAFESRYPDTSEPNLTPLKTLALWINSCKGNQQKWNDEKEDHFDLPKLAAYYVYLMRFGAVDQTVKNAMITTEDGEHWFFINYDNDTVLGIDNISTVLNRWDYTRGTSKGGGLYYYAGHESVLWNCFEADAECMALVRKVDEALYSAGLSYANLNKMFDEEQCDRWCERIYNDNSVYKYIQPFKEKGSAVLYMLQGNRKSYRHWWLQHRMDLFDAMWASAAYKSRIIRFIAEGAENKTFSLESAIDTYYGYGINSVAQETGVYVEHGDTHDFTISQRLAIGDPVAIYNANNITRIDLSDFATYLTTLYINAAVGADGTSHLKSLILGDGESENSIFTEIGGLSAITGLEEIDIRGFKAMTGISLSSLPLLHKFKAADSGLTAFAPAAGVTLTEVSLPNTLQSLILNQSNVSSLTYTPTTTLRSVSLQNVSGAWDAKTFVNTWLAMLSDAQLEDVQLTLTGINWTGMTADEVITLGKTGTHTLRGKVTISTMTIDQFSEMVELFGMEAFNPSSSFYILTPTMSSIGISESEIRGGSGATLTSMFLPVVEGSTVEYEMFYNGSKVQPSGGTATVNGVSLNTSTGVIQASYQASTCTLSFRAARLADGILEYTENVSAHITAVTYPSSITISGNSSLVSVGSYNYSKAFNTNNFNAEIISTTWSLAQSSCLSITEQSASGATLALSAIPDQSEQVALTCTVLLENNVTLTDTLNVSVVVTPITSFTLSGDDRITTEGNYSYLIENILPANYNKGISSLSARVTTPTSGQVNVVQNGLSGVKLVVTTMPNATESVTVTVNASIGGSGNTITATKTVELKVIIPYVDLGLPSGKLWRKMNIGANEPEETGDYFSWGNIEGHAAGDGYNFSQANYNNTPGASLTGDITPDGGYDAAREILGDGWRMPTKAEFEELANKTDKEWVTNYANTGVNGYKFMKKSNHDVYIFIPAAGSRNGTSNGNVGSSGNYWSATSSSATNAYRVYFGTTSFDSASSNTRYLGFSIRPIKDNPVAPFNVITSQSNPELMAAMYSLGLSASPDAMTNYEAAAVTASQLMHTVNYTMHHTYYDDDTGEETSETITGTLNTSIFNYMSASTIEYSRNEDTGIEDYISLTNKLFTSPVSFNEFVYFTGISNTDLSSIFGILCNIGSLTLHNGITRLFGTFNNCHIDNITLNNYISEIEYSFNKCYLPSITIPDSVTSIVDSFGKTSEEQSTMEMDTTNSLEEIVWGQNPSVTTISNSFIDCYSLAGIFIPASVTNISSSFNISLVTSITVAAGNTVYDSRDNCNAIVETATNKIIKGCKNTTIPSTVTAFGNLAFYRAEFSSITIPASVVSIGDYCFYLNAVLQTVTFEPRDGVALSVGPHCFEYCALTSVVLPSELDSIPSRMFFGCTALTSVTIPSGITSIGEEAFYNCSSLGSITIPEGVTSIPNSMCKFCYKLETVDIPSTVTSIGGSVNGKGAFLNCQRLKTITCRRASAPSIGQYTFSGIGTSVSSGKTLNVPSSATGYNTGNWNTYVVNKGYTLNKTL